MGYEHIEGDPRSVLAAAGVGVGEQPAQIAVALERLGEEDDVRVAEIVVGRLDVELGADDGADMLALGGDGEADDAGEGVVVGDGEGFEAEHAGLLDHGFGVADAVQEGVVGVGVEFGVLGFGEASSPGGAGRGGGGRAHR